MVMLDIVISVCLHYITIIRVMLDSVISVCLHYELTGQLFAAAGHSQSKVSSYQTWGQIHLYLYLKVFKYFF